MPIIGGNHRCAICNCVNNEEIATFPEEYKHTTFVPDPSSPYQLICLECREAIDEVDGEWLDDEEFYDEDEGYGF